MPTKVKWTVFIPCVDFNIEQQWIQETNVSHYFFFQKLNHCILKKTTNLDK